MIPCMIRETMFVGIYRIGALVIIGAILLSSGCNSPSGPSESDDPSALRMISNNPHFEYYYDGLDQSRIQFVIDALERNYDRIISALTAINMPVVRAKIWIDENGFYNAMHEDLGRIFAGAKGYVMGPDELRLLLTHRGDINAVHEFVHCVSLQINETIANNPRWLWETVALYLSNDFIPPSSLYYMVAGNYPTIRELDSGYNVNQSVYQVGYVLGQYIVEKWGMNALRNLVLQNGDIEAVLEVSERDLEDGWHEWLELTYLHD